MNTPVLSPLGQRGTESSEKWRARQRIFVTDVQEDPLSVENWYALLVAEEEHFRGKNGSNESLLRLYREATRVLPCGVNVNNELYLRIWIGFAKQQMKVNVEDALDTFKFLESKNIGDNFALRFTEWAKLELHAGYRTKALQVLKKGFSLQAMPVSELHRQYLDIYAADKARLGTPGNTKNGSPVLQQTEGKVQPHGTSSLSSMSVSMTLVSSPATHSCSSNTGSSGSDTASSGGTQETVNCMHPPANGALKEDANIPGNLRKFPKRLKPLGPPLRVVGPPLRVTSEEKSQAEKPDSSGSVPGNKSSLVPASVERSGKNVRDSPLLLSSMSEKQDGVSESALGESDLVGDLRKRKAESPLSLGDTSQLLSHSAAAEGLSIVEPAANSPEARATPGQLPGGAKEDSRPFLKEDVKVNAPGKADMKKSRDVADVRERDQFDVNALQERLTSFRKQLDVNGGSPAKGGDLILTRPHLQNGISKPAQGFHGTRGPTIPSSGPMFETTDKEVGAVDPVHVDLLSHSLSSITLLEKDENAGDHQNMHLQNGDVYTNIPAAAAASGGLVGQPAHSSAHSSSVPISESGHCVQKHASSPGDKMPSKQKPKPYHSSELKVYCDKSSGDAGGFLSSKSSSIIQRSGPASNRQPLKERCMNKPESKVVAAQPRKRQENENFVVVNGKRYQKIGKIGSGGSSEVFKVIDAECSIFALKRINLREKDHTSAIGFYQEISYLERLHGKRHIIRLVDHEVTNKNVLERPGSAGENIKEDGTIYLVLEYGEIVLGGMLAEKRKSAADSKQILDENWLRLYWQHMLEAVETIHEERIVHSDLKPANFLLVKGELKLIDFGIAKAIQNDTTNIVRDHMMGTVNYMSPEALMQNTINEKGEVVKVGRASDIWSLGCILYEMVYGHSPFSHHLSTYAKMKEITNPSQKISYPPVSNPWLLDAMKKCLCWNPQERLRIPDLLVHPFLRPDLAPTPATIPRGLEVLPHTLQQLILQVESISVTDACQLKSQVLGLLYRSLQEGSRPRQ